MSAPDLILETRRLERRFGGVRAVAGVDFKLERGELALPDRAERRRQEHVLQDADWPDPAERRPASCSRAERSAERRAARDRPARHRHQEPGAGRLRRT